MNDLTLLIMAAGMGSRYGGLKQLDAMGPSGETIMEYSVHDAIKTGFTKVVFIIREDFASDFKLKITDKFSDKIQVVFAFQNLHNLPNGYSCPNNRVKPWGTGHAILSAADLINEPFCVINADDFYGREAYQKITDFYSNENNSFSMVAYRLDQTLSSFGGVSRGICRIENGCLINVTETENVIQTESSVTSDQNKNLDGSEPVSVNIWGFTPIIFDYLNEMFLDFLIKKGAELKSEFLIPTVVNDLIQNNREQVQILRSDASWFGVTYREDKQFVINKIQHLIDEKVYPASLFD